MMFSVPYVKAISYIDLVVYVFMNVMIYPEDEQSFVSSSMCAPAKSYVMGSM